MTNVFRTPGALIPSTCLSPFGAAINDSFYAFSPTDSCGPWSGAMGQMSHRMAAHAAAAGGGDHFGLPPSISRQGFGQSFSNPCGAAMAGLGGYGPMTGLTNGVSHSPPGAAGSSMYSSVPTAPPYCMGGGCESPLSAGSSLPPSCGVQDIGDIWRGSSIANLRKKALEHTASAVSGMAGFRWVSSICI